MSHKRVLYMKRSKFEIRQAVECFHLIFLDQLGRKLNKQLYALKGGCNLRFFLKSIRYSEDIDLDVHTVAVDTLAKKVDGILSSIPFQSVLATHGIKLKDFSKPNQTTTTQRWKLLLDVEGIQLQLPTKLEFSRRSFDEKISFENIDPYIISQHHLTPIFSSHYLAPAAFVQKCNALIHRTETQARDVFDLWHLLNTQTDFIYKKIDEFDHQKAIDTILTVSFDDYKSQVVSYLSYDYQQQYGTKEMWDIIVLKLIEIMER